MNCFKRLSSCAANKTGRRLAAVFAVLSVLAFGGLFFGSPAAAADSQKNTVNLYIFWGDGCPHCAHAKKYLEPYVRSHDNIGYKAFEVYNDTANQKKMKAVGELLDITASGVPLIVVGDKPFVGFTDGTGREIVDRLDYCSVRTCPDSVASVLGFPSPAARDYPVEVKDGANGGQITDGGHSSALKRDKIIDLPLIGTINAAHFSLPVLTVIFGLLDGFNPCAMWALLFIITLLVGMHDRRKMWLYGSAFIVTSALVYFVFMAAWLNLFMFIGHVVWVRSVIGLMAIGVGGYYLYDWHRKKTGCKVAGKQKRRAVFEKLRSIVKERNVWFGLGGVIVLAAAVNIVELACSAGLPVVYTGILSSAGLVTGQYYAYMLLYILFFMLDDLVVFAVAMTTFRVIGIESKYTRVTRLVGGVLMCVLGLLLIFAPQALMFG